MGPCPHCLWISQYIIICPCIFTDLFACFPPGPLALSSGSATFFFFLKLEFYVAQSILKLFMWGTMTFTSQSPGLHLSVQGLHACVWLSRLTSCTCTALFSEVTVYLFIYFWFMFCTNVWPVHMYVHHMHHRPEVDVRSQELEL